MKSPYKLAVLSDIHGNRWALEAVLDDLKRRDIRQIVNLGDSFYGPLDPAGTAALLMDLNLPTVSGNEDRVLVEKSDKPLSPTVQFTLSQLNSDHLQWLAGLPLTRVYGDFLLCHGTPSCDHDYLMLSVTENGITAKCQNELNQLLAGIEQTMILCGHDHTPRVLSLPDGRTIVNPGSVGLQAYSDTDPLPHSIEIGDPLARYSIVTGSPLDWTVDNMCVSYDYSAAAKAALEHGRPDWANWLSTGCV